MNTYHTLIVSISFLFFLFIHPHVCVDISSKNVTGFSLKLIHRDSPESPYYPGRELTFDEKVSRYSKATDARASYLSALATQNFTRNDPIVGRGVIQLNAFSYYMVSVNIGSPKVNLLFLLDTASDVVWTQCKPCINCFPQKGDMYDSSKSRDFQYLPCTDGLCRDKLRCGPDNKCHYDLQYGGGSRTKGVAMKETFVFPPNDRAMIFNNFVMGCSNDNQGFAFERTGNIGGILGMSSSPHSLPSQLAGVGANVFSYCLTAKNTPTYLRFGNDIVHQTMRPLQSIPFIHYEDAYYYGFELEDIGVNGTRLNFPPGTFAPRRYGAGGCFIDSGAPISMIDQPAFDRFIAQYERFFLPKRLVRNTNDCPDPRQYCYDGRGIIGVVKLPYVTFHFKGGATYYMPPKNLVLNSNNHQSYFFLMIKPGDRTIIGAWQQHDIRIIHDLRPGYNQLSFSFEDCSNDPAT